MGLHQNHQAFRSALGTVTSLTVPALPGLVGRPAGSAGGSTRHSLGSTHGSACHIRGGAGGVPGGILHCALQLGGIGMSNAQRVGAAGTLKDERAQLHRRRLSMQAFGRSLRAEPAAALCPHLGCLQCAGGPGNGGRPLVPRRTLGLQGGMARWLRMSGLLCHLGSTGRSSCQLSSSATC